MVGFDSDSREDPSVSGRQASVPRDEPGTPTQNRPRFCRSGVVGRQSDVGHGCGPSGYPRRGRGMFGGP